MCGLSCLVWWAPEEGRKVEGFWTTDSKSRGLFHTSHSWCRFKLHKCEATTVPSCVQKMCHKDKLLIFGKKKKKVGLIQFQLKNKAFIECGSCGSCGSLV